MNFDFADEVKCENCKKIIGYFIFVGDGDNYGFGQCPECRNMEKKAK